MPGYVDNALGNMESEHRVDVVTKVPLFLDRTFRRKCYPTERYYPSIQSCRHAVEKEAGYSNTCLWCTLMSQQTKVGESITLARSVAQVHDSRDGRIQG